MEKKNPKQHHTTTYKIWKSGSFLLHIYKYSHPVYKADIAQIFKPLP